MIHQKVYRRQLFSIVCASLTGIAIIIGRLFYLQVINAPAFIDRGQKNFTRLELVQSVRGPIVDCRGALLATNKPSTDIYWQGSGGRNLTQGQIEALDKLVNILNCSYSRENIAYAERRYQHVLLASDISLEQLCRVQELFADYPHIAVKTNYKRYYPYQHSAAHIVGYLGAWDSNYMGKMGLEKICEPVLKGEQGIVVQTINSVGKRLDAKESKQVMDGQTIQLTLDIELTKLAESVFGAHYTGAFILLDPLTGAVKVLISRPTFDPSLFLGRISSEVWQQMQEYKPLLNRALSATYPLGSIFKLVTMSAALEQGIVNQDTAWDCKGYVRFAGRNYRCNMRQGHGIVSLEQSLALSCNTGFFHMANYMPIDMIADYAYRYGFGQKTGTVLSEQQGLVPNSAWKLRSKGERWWPGETLSAVIGQGPLLVTPMQVARMIGSIFTGNLVTPRLLENEPLVTTPLAISQATREFLQRAMIKVVTEGTARAIGALSFFEVYAKTSTAQTSALEKRHLGGKYLEHGWFASYFKYKDNSPLVMVILVENAGSASIPTRLAREFFIKYRSYMDNNTYKNSFMS
ncbi:hypothetical protein KG892_01120 [Vermiphilus pyriformis]|nr:MAG: hypothetical protein KG892_01120 [Vermiphilus pyriformis]